MARIEAFLLRPYELPLRGSWRSARGGFHSRRGWLIGIVADGLCGHGDCAPLPEAGTESPTIAAHSLQRLQDTCTGRDSAEIERIPATLAPQAPATAHALECALLDLASRQRGIPLRHLLNPHASDCIAVNGVIGALDTGIADRAREQLAQGFRILKIKVGCAPPEQELELLRDLATELPDDVQLRLDANGAWDPTQARRMLDALADLPIESLEEPLRSPTAQTLADLQERVPFALARDESLHGLGEEIDAAALGVRRLVLKPAALGGLWRTLALAGRARATGVEIVLTSVVESAAGVWNTAQLAAASASPLAHGLATACWLAEDLGQPPLIEAGRMRLTGVPGSGFAPFPES